MSRQFLLEAMPVPMVFATHRIIREANAAFLALFGYSREELIDQSFNRLYPRLADFVMVGELWKTNLSGGRTYTDERIMQRHDGTSFWCRVRGRSLVETNPFVEAIYCFDEMTRLVLPHGDRLTGRQRQILSLMVLGKTSADIAIELGLSRRSVDTHRLRLRKALGVRNTAELAAWYAGVGRDGDVRR